MESLECVLCACACGKGLNVWVFNYVCMCLYSVVAAAATVVNGRGDGTECLRWLRNHNHHLWGWQVVNNGGVGANFG